MSDWPIKDWYFKHVGEEAWMVCRNGHLWSARVPESYWLKDRSPPRTIRKMLDAIRKCPTCTVLKQAGDKNLRGITKVCPDFNGVIVAKRLRNGTIEHHHPEQVTQAYSEENVKAWSALQALLGLVGDRL